MGRLRGIVFGTSLALAARELAVRAIREKFRRDVESLNAGDYGPLLSSYSEDAVLRFHEGPHRWSGVHRGKEAIERFLVDFTNAGLKGEVGEVWLGGAPWAATLVARFDDQATSEAGERVYANRVVIILRTRWGKVVEHEDFYEDTGRIEALESHLRDAG